MTNKELSPQLTKSAAVQEFETQLTQNNPFELMRRTFDDYQKGPLTLALGAVGGNGAASKAMGILEQLDTDRVPFQVVAMTGYLKNNPLITNYFEKKSITPILTDDQTDRTQLYQNCFQSINRLAQRTCGILSLGPRTYYPEAARRASLPALIIDGAVPDKWETIDNGATPTTEYYLPAYLNGTYATTCAFPDWQPPQNSYPEDLKLKTIAQPFSAEKISFLRELRNLSPQECRLKTINSNEIKGLEAEDDSILVIPTMDQVYLDPNALSTFDRFLLPEQLGQAYGFMAELITGLFKQASETNRRFSLYLPQNIQAQIAPLINQYQGEGLKIIEPNNRIISNQTWLMLRKAGVEIGRAPLCVSTAEAFGMDNYVIMTATPGKTSDGTSYMTEAEALEFLASKPNVCCPTLPGQSLIEAIENIIQVKNL